MSVAQEAQPSYIHLVLTPLTQVYLIVGVQLLELPEEEDDPPLDPVHVPVVVSQSEQPAEQVFLLLIFPPVFTFEDALTE